VDDYGVKCIKKEDFDHLIASIKGMYALTEDWTGNLYCGIALNLDYNDQTVNITMPGYVKRTLQEYNRMVSK
jgi:hypothetical protein